MPQWYFTLKHLNGSRQITGRFKFGSLLLEADFKTAWLKSFPVSFKLSLGKICLETERGIQFAIMNSFLSVIRSSGLPLRDFHRKIEYQIYNFLNVGMQLSNHSSCSDNYLECKQQITGQGHSSESSKTSALINIPLIEAVSISSVLHNGFSFNKTD